jgi:hypothetical protein
LWVALAASLAQAQTVEVLLKDGKRLEGSLKAGPLELGSRKVAWKSVLTVHQGAKAEGEEAARIGRWLDQVGGAVRAERDSAVLALSDIGVTAMTPLLERLKDTDQHEPRPLYRLFRRLVPNGADQAGREAAVVRLAGGEVWRGEVGAVKMTVGGTEIAWADVRRVAVRQAMVRKSFDLEALQHSTQIEYLDSGVGLTAESTVTSAAKGFVRLAWNQDGWASDADGLKVPGPNYKTNLVDGHPFGAVVGRSGMGEVIRVGAGYSGRGLAAGRWQMAVNDNRHWQNNVGAFRVTLTVTNAYDLGEAQ